MLRVNSRSLRVVTVILQSIYNKKYELNPFLIENDVDIHTFFISNAFFSSQPQCCIIRGGYRTASTSKMENFVLIVNDWKPLAIVTKSSILDVAAVLDPHLITFS